jgi:hypothetical protein
MSVEQTHRIQLDGNGDVMDDQTVANVHAGRNPDGSIPTQATVRDVDLENAHAERVLNYGTAAGGEAMPDAEVTAVIDKAEDTLKQYEYHVEIAAHQEAAGLPVSKSTSAAITGLRYDIGIQTDNLPKEIRDNVDQNLLDRGIQVPRFN